MEEQRLQIRLDAGQLAQRNAVLLQNKQQILKDGGRILHGDLKSPLTILLVYVLNCWMLAHLLRRSRMGLIDFENNPLLLPNLLP